MKVKVAQSCLTLWVTMDCTIHGILHARILEKVAIPFSRGSSQLRESNPGLPLCRQILYHLNHQGSPESGSRSVVPNFLPPHGLCSLRNSPGQNTGVGSLSLLQGIFPTQESNLCLPHCRRIPYQLSYQGSPDGAVRFNWDNTYKHLE